MARATHSQTPARRVGEQIRRQRRFMCLTQDELAAALDVSQTTISFWEKGRSEVALRHRRKLAEALRLDVGLLFADEVAA